MEILLFSAAFGMYHTLHFVTCKMLLRHHCFVCTSKRKKKMLIVSVESQRCTQLQGCVYIFKIILKHLKIILRIKAFPLASCPSVSSRHLHFDCSSSSGVFRLQRQEPWWWVGDAGLTGGSLGEPAARHSPVPGSTRSLGSPALCVRTSKLRVAQGPRS